MLIADAETLAETSNFHQEVHLYLWYRVLVLELTSALFYAFQPRCNTNSIVWAYPPQEPAKPIGFLHCFPYQ